MPAILRMAKDLPDFAKYFTGHQWPRQYVSADRLYQPVIDCLVDIAERLAVQRIHPVVRRGTQVEALARHIVPRQLGQFPVVDPYVPINVKRQTGGLLGFLQMVFAAVPTMVKTLLARADSGFYCWDAVQAYESVKCGFIIVARKTARLVEELNAAEWQRSPQTDADGRCAFWYQPDGWGKAYRFLALRYEKQPKVGAADAVEQYQLFETSKYIYRVFVTNMEGPVHTLVAFYNQRAAAENLIKEANNDAGADGPSLRALDDELQLVSGRDAGLQPELLATVVQSRGRRRSGIDAAHDAGDGALAVLVLGCQDLAARWASRRQL
jgi:hypothetical protein